jgi:hypothetical protein
VGRQRDDIDRSSTVHRAIDRLSPGVARHRRIASRLRVAFR